VPNIPITDNEGVAAEVSLRLTSHRRRYPAVRRSSPKTCTDAYSQAFPTAKDAQIHGRQEPRLYNRYHFPKHVPK